MIKRKDTTKLKHYHARTIAGFQVVENAVTGEEEPIVAFTGDIGSKYDAREVVLPITVDAWDRAANGTGTAPEDLANGLDRAARYRFVILTDNIPTGNKIDKKDPKTKEVKKVAETREHVVGFICFPDTNYINADFSVELNKPIPDNAVVMHVYDNGEFDIVAFPKAAGKDVVNFVRAIEPLKEITSRTKVETADFTYAISSTFGTEVMFKARKKKTAQ